MPTTSAAAALRDVALEQFAAKGFEGASLQRIAEQAGVSKSSVLYHYASKEALLDAALRPTIDDLRALVAQIGDLAAPPAREAFLERFVAFQFQHRLAVVTLVNHGASLRDAPVVAEADGLVRELALVFAPEDGDDLDSVRFGVAMAGATFVLAAADRWSVRTLDEDEVRRGLVAVLGELVLGSARTELRPSALA